MILENKKNFIEKVIFIFFIILFSLVFYNFANASIVSPTNEFYVNDYANVLSDATKNYIMNMNIELEKKTGAQVVVVTINSLDGEAIETYSTNLFRKFEIGDENKNNGLLLLLAVEDRESRIEVGYGLEGALTDGKTGRIQDEYMIPYYSNNYWDDGIKNGFDACLSVIMDEYNIEIDGAKYVEVSETLTNRDILEDIILIIVFIIMMIISIKMGGIGRGLYIGGFHIGSSKRRWT